MRTLIGSFYLLDVSLLNQNRKSSDFPAVYIKGNRQNQNVAMIEPKMT